MDATRYQAMVTSHWKFRFFLITRLPMVWLAGIRVRHFDDRRTEVTLPYKYLTKNPFRSTFWACQGMAAELSTGIMAHGHVQSASQRVSMLVVKSSAAFHKKATGRVTFVCDEGPHIEAAVQEAIQSGEGVQLEVKSTGYSADKEVVSEFWFTWSFKAKS